jgi:hypothetical protein
LGTRSSGLCFVAILFALGCLEQLRDGQWYMQRLEDPITFSGYVRNPTVMIDIFALNRTTLMSERVTSATSLTDPADCDVEGQCRYRFSVAKVLPKKYWKNIGALLHT